MTFVLIVAALIAFFVQPVVAVVLLALAGLNMYLKDRQKKERHNELLAATGRSGVEHSATPKRSQSKTVPERFAELEDLKESGAITAEEYAAKRQEILDAI